MQKTQVSKNTVKIYRPNFASSKLPTILGLYEPIDSALYSFKNDKNEQITNFEFISYRANIKHKITKAEVYVKLTEGCNFACPGCVTASDRIKPQDARHLTLKTLTYLLENIFISASEKGFKEIRFKWAGGEPLLQISYNLICEIQPTLKLFSKKYKTKTKQVILTNGVFIDTKKINFFKKNSIKLSISLWGIKDIQDKARKPRNGRESFETIAKNICEVHKSGIKYSVNHVITPENSKYFVDFLELMWNTKSDKFIGKNYEIKTPIPVFFAIYRPQGEFSSIFLAL